MQITILRQITGSVSVRPGMLLVDDTATTTFLGPKQKLLCEAPLPSTGNKLRPWGLLSAYSHSVGRFR